MTKLLIKLFVKDYKNTQNEKVRINYGVLSGGVGVAVNVLLSVFKMIFGKITASIAITADGMNNLFDAISSIISLVGFKISGKPADKEHPFGHGRIEYLSALVLAFLIITTGVELIKTSFEKFNDPSAVIFGVPAVIVLSVSVLMKVWLAVFNTKVGRRINSVTVDAVVKDSLGDIAATLCSMIALFASKYTSLPLDAVMGIIVAVIIIFNGIDVIKSTLGPLLGEPPDASVVNELESIVMSHEGIIGIHDLVLHTYGHSKVMGSLHAEVPADKNIMESHDTIDLIESEIKEKLGFEISIHMDPVLINDERTNELKEYVTEIVKSISPDITIHDFRVVDGPTHTNLIFDSVLPYDSKISEEEFKNTVKSRISGGNKKYYAVMTVDRSYVL